MEERVIRNFDSLATTPLRHDALSLAEAAYAASSVATALKKTMSLQEEYLHLGDTSYPVADRRIFFIGIGKCALAAAIEIERILGERLAGGIALDVANPEKHTLSKIKLLLGTHPLPSEKNVVATEHIFQLLEQCNKDDLVLMLISGGGSTLLCHPKAPMTCLDESILFRELSAAGTPIQDLNIVRKHTSTARGGGLAKAAYPAEVISLIVSDVPGNNIAYISSGPTIKDDSSITDATDILTRHAVLRPSSTTLIETPKEEKYYERVTNLLMLTNNDGLTAMEVAARQRGYTPTIISNHIAGEARDVGRAIITALHDAPAKTVLLYAGETTVTFATSSFGEAGPPKAQSKGGRSQEMTLGALDDIRANECLIPFASDGHDNSDHAGAIGDVVTQEHMRAEKISTHKYLTDHRSYDFFTATNDALVTGYTGSNVSDFIIAIKN